MDHAYEMLAGKSVLITGASRGIGAAAGRAFAEAGAHVGLAARDDAALESLATETGGLVLPCDVSDYGAVEAAVHRMRDRFGRLDVLVTNAGVIGPIGPIDAADPAAWAATVQVNLTGVFHCIRAALPQMRLQGGGTILNVSSGAAHGAVEGWSAYCASKAGAAMLTDATHLEAAADGIRVMGLSPGTVATDMQAQIRASGINPVSRLDWSAHIPPEWVAKALMWMCTPDSDLFLGQEVQLRDERLRQRLGLVR